jgi:flagellar protein FlgJ
MTPMMTPMMTPGLTSPTAPALSSAATAALAGKTPAAGSREAKAKATGEDFEAMFLNSMFQQMFSGVGQGPFSGGPGANIWRSFLTDEYSKSFVKAGGIGIAPVVTRQLLAQQEVRS